MRGTAHLSFEQFLLVLALLVAFTVAVIAWRAIRPRGGAGPPRGSPAFQRFVDSMQIDRDRWRDGEPYDLAALDALAPGERARAEALLVPRRHNDWRDAQALARLATPGAIAALEDSVRGPSRPVRLEAARLLTEMGRPVDLDGVIVESLADGRFGDGLQEALNLAQRHPTPRVWQAILDGARNAGPGVEAAAHLPALALFLRGQTREPFDQAEQPFLQRFRSPDPAVREAAFRALCQRIGEDPQTAGRAPS